MKPLLHFSISIFFYCYVKVIATNYGDLVSIENCPYYAYLTKGYTKNFKCGGAVIDYTYILTAAHCLDDKDFHVYVGIGTLEDLDTAVAYKVAEVQKFPWYTGNNVWDDVGLVKLETKLGFTHHVQPISLATDLPPIGAEVVILGFGEVDCTNDNWDSRYYPCDQVPSKYLRTAIVNVSDTGYGVLYTKTRSRNGCHGDSGGPIVYQGAVVGVVTTGSHNGCSSQDTHVSIPAKYTWLHRQILGSSE